VVLLNDTFHLTMLPVLLTVATGLLVWWEAWSIIAAAVLYLVTGLLAWEYFKRPRKT
jgi:hypothetical protein